MTVVQHVAEVKMVVNDGLFDSEPAFTTVHVLVINEAPRILPDGKVRKHIQCIPTYGVTNFLNGIID